MENSLKTAQPADSVMANGPNKSSGNLPKHSPSEDGFDEDEELSNEEVSSLCATIDQLESCLDDLEQKNDSLNAKLKAFIESMNEEKEQHAPPQEVDKTTKKDK